MLVFENLYTSAALFLWNCAPLPTEKGASWAPLMYLLWTPAV